MSDDLPATDTASQQATLSQVIARIRASLELETIFQTTATEVRQLMQADRVGVFQFYPEQAWAGELVAEDIAPGVISALEQRIEDHCFSEHFAHLYKAGRIQAIADIQSDDSQSCYLERMSSLQVRGSIVAPLLQGEALWGLLCIHQCHHPRQWQSSDIEFVRQIAAHLSVALHHANLLAQAHAQADQQRALTAIIARIRASLDLETIFHTTAVELRQLLQVDRVGVFQFFSPELRAGKFVAEAVVQGIPSILKQCIHDPCFADRYDDVFPASHIHAVADVDSTQYQECYHDLMRSLQVRANLVVPLLQGEHLWGLLCIHQCLAPRTWQASEIEFVRQIGEQLSIALQQRDYLQQVQRQSTQLAEALERQRAAERHRAIAETVDKIRRTLDDTTIFQTTTDEVNQLFATDRTVIYRFNPDWSGEFVAETVEAPWLPIKGTVSPFTDTCLQETQASRYRQNPTPHAVVDIYATNYSQCHVDMLATLQVRAFLIAPIFQQEALWGLLAVYQNDGPRQWQPEESYVLAQIAAQLGIAIQQAEYLNRLETQSSQLARATERQRSLANTIDKIRQSLDIQTIFQATTQEVRQLLGVERIAIYRFYPDWRGEFVADSMMDGWQSQPQLPESPGPLLSESTTPGQYPRHEVFVPILQGDKLWGLLMAYQSRPQIWPEADIDLMAQVGGQLGVALQQAELLEKTLSQKVRLTRALQKIQQSQAHLIQSEKMAGLGQLVAGVAHEINNPVNFIAGNLSHVQRYTSDVLALLQQYQRALPNPDPTITDMSAAIDLDFLVTDLPKTLASMTLGTQRIRQIVQSLQNFSRLDQAEMKAVDIHEGLDSTLLILQHRLKGEKHAPAIDLVKQYGQLPPVECYPAQLNQVFMNILSNAIDALQHPGQQLADPSPRCIRLYTETIELNWVRIRIVDNGPGIPETIQGKVFDPFFTTKEPGHGTGLGLSICYQIITEKHNGHLQCHSRATGGTEFLIEIPIRQTKTTAPATRE